MSARDYVAGLDIGTTGVKAMIFGTDGSVAGTAYREYPCICPKPGIVEQDVDQVWENVCEATRELIAACGIDPARIRSLGISSQRGTFLPVDKAMRPLMNSLVYSDIRAQEETEWIRREIGDDRYHEITGVTISSIWSYPKFKWIIDREKAIFERTFKFVNGQEYFLHRLGAEDLSTDPASISLNGMLDVKRLAWSEELCARIGLPMEKLPPMGTPARQVGKVSRKASEETGFAVGMPVAIGAGDQQCAAVGAGIIKEGMAEITIGTAMVMVAHMESRKRDPKKLVLVGGSGIPGKWDMEGLMTTAGSVLKWWRDVHGWEEKAAAKAIGVDVYDIITLEASKAPPGCKGFIFFPFFQGLLTPKYYDYATGGTLGLSLIHDKKDMARSVLEGITFEINMVVGAMEEVLGGGFRIIRLSGGGARSHLWNQIQSDIYGRPVERLRVSECTTLGAAVLGAVGCGVFASVEGAVGEMVHPFDTIEPDMKKHELYREQFGIFQDVYELLAKHGMYERVWNFRRKHAE
jgi:xylulokinase